jgi:hypothetical protein
MKDAQCGCAAGAAPFNNRPIPIDGDRAGDVGQAVVTVGGIVGQRQGIGTACNQVDRVGCNGTICGSNVRNQVGCGKWKKIRGVHDARHRHKENHDRREKAG